MTLPQGVKLLR